MNKNIRYNNRNIFYRVTGNRKPVILIHGFGEDGEVWNNQVAYLKDTVQLIVPDLPGSGQSEMITDMSIEGMAETIHAIIHEENIDQCTVIGHSMGGYITLAFAEKYPNHLNAFALFHSTAFADTEEKKVTRRKGIDFINQHGAFEFLRTTTPNLFSQKTKDERPSLINQFIETLRNFSPQALTRYYEAMMQRPDRTSVLSLTPVPVMFVIGEYDIAAPLQDVLKQCYLPGIADVRILHESGHMGMLEQSDKGSIFLQHFLTFSGS